MKRIASLLLALLCLISALSAVAEGVPTGENIRKVTLTCTGDALLGASESVRKKGAGTYSYDAYIEKNGYAWPFAGLYDMFSRDDITFVNLENVLADEIKGGFSKSRLVFRGPSDYAKILTEGSVEVVNLANNHTENYGTEGMDKTVAALEAEGIGYSGTTFGLNAERLLYSRDRGYQGGLRGPVPALQRQGPLEEPGPGPGQLRRLQGGGLPGDRGLHPLRGRVPEKARGHAGKV